MRRRILRALGYVLAWAVVAVPAWAVLFTHSSSEMVLASHDAVVHPTLDGQVRLDMGPYVPDVRTSSGGRIGVFVEMRKTTASSTGELATAVRRDRRAPGGRAGASDRRGRGPRARRGPACGRRRPACRSGCGCWSGTSAARSSGGGYAAPTGGVRSAPGSPPSRCSGAWSCSSPSRGARDPERVQADTWLSVQEAIPDVTVPQDLQAWQIQGGTAHPGHAPAPAQPVRHLRPEQGLLRRRRRPGPRGRRPAAQAGRGRDDGGVGQRPARQHRHGRGRARGGRRGRRHRGAGRRRRHLDGRDLGGVQPRLAGQGVRGLRPPHLRRGQPRQRDVREPLPGRSAAGPTSTARRSSRSPTCG